VTLARVANGEGMDFGNIAKIYKHYEGRDFEFIINQNRSCDP
jgi:hypothetical protein